MINNDVDTINCLAYEIHQNAKDHGFYDFAQTLTKDHGQQGWVTAKLEKIARITSEVGELSEAVCKPGESEHIGDAFSAEEEEAADIIIRVLDLAGFCGWNIGRAVEKKMAYNKTRPHMHGKKA